MIRSQRYLVTTKVGAHSRKRVWDSSRPIGIGFPFRWILERTKDGARIRSLGGYPGEAAGATSESVQLRINEDHLAQGETLDLPVDRAGGSPMSMRIQPIRRIHAPYMVNGGAERQDSSGQPVQLFAYSGIQRSMVECDQVHGAYVATFRGKPVFTAYKNGDGIQIKPLLSGIFIKVKGGPAIPAYPNETLQLASHKVPMTTVVRGSYWWKFNFVRLPEPPSPEDLSQDDNEAKWFAGFLTLFGVLFVLLVGSIIALMPTQIEELKKTDEDLIKKAPVITYHTFRKPDHKLHMPHAATKTAGSAGSAAKAVTQQPQKHDAVPAPMLTAEKTPVPKKAPASAPAAVAKTVDTKKKPPQLVRRKLDKQQPGMKVLNAIPIKTAAIKAPPAPPQPNPAEVAAKKSAAAAARQARFLQEALSGAKSMAANHDIMSTANDDPNAAGTMMGASIGGSITPTEVHSRYNGSGKAVAGFGGGATDPNSDGAGGSGHAAGVGYGTGKRAGLAGQGDSLVNVDSGAAEVAEGLTKEEVGRVIHAHMTEIRYCHEQSLLSNPQAQGKVVLEFTINASGRVEVVNQQSNTVPEGSLAPCVSHRLQSWKFPNPKGGVKVTVSYPFLFRTLGKE